MKRNVMTWFLCAVMSTPLWGGEVEIGKCATDDPDEPAVFSAPESIDIPVFFHVINRSPEAAGNVSDTALSRQIDLLNASYGGVNVDETPLRFVMGGVTRTTNVDWSTMTQGSDAERQAKSALRLGGSAALNVYVVDLSAGVDGWTSVRRDTDDSMAAVMDGAVVDYETLAGEAAAVAKVGQWLGVNETPEPSADSVTTKRRLTPRSTVTRVPESVGHANSGAGVVLVDLNGNGGPELIAFYIDNPPGANFGYYRVGFDVDSSGQAAGDWSARKDIPGTVGHETDGGDVAVADINGNGRPELFVYYIDDPNGENRGYYRIGWDLNSVGTATSWSDSKAIDPGGWFGAANEGGGLAVVDLNGNSMPELIAFFIVNPSGENWGYYRIGWDLNANGAPTAGWTLTQVRQWFGASNQGAGIAVTDINNNGKLDLLVFFITNPGGANYGYYHIGWDLNAAGTPTLGWTVQQNVQDWFGDENDGAVVAVADLNGNGLKDYLVYFIPDPAGDNHGFYHVGWERGSTW